MRRMWILVAAMVAAFVAWMGAPPMAQVDVWTRAPVSASALTLDVAPLRLALASRPGFMPRSAPGQAFAAADQTEAVMNAVSVTQMAPDHLRIRLAASDEEDALAVARALADGASATVDERLVLSSTTRGGPLSMLATALGLLAALALACEGCAARRRHRRRVRLAMPA